MWSGFVRSGWFAALIVVVWPALLTGCSRVGATGESVGIGFRSYWVTDPVRTYRTTFDDGATYGAMKSPRPVLVNIWYPARAAESHMKHGEYLQIVAADPKLKPLSVKLLEYERNVITQELSGVDRTKMSEAAAQGVERMMSRETPAVRDAPPASGRYPLVIYHSGAGSSFEDNALLCEQLAQDGFVVIGSAFFEADGSSFNIDSDNAGREIEFLLRLAVDMDNVDIGHVGLVGHSAGAHGALMYAAHGGVALDAVISLDTTQDYRTLTDPRWSVLVQTLHRGYSGYVTPTMFVAGPTAMFELADSIDRCERLYLTFPGLDHNDYIAQGEWTARVAAETQPDPDGQRRAHAEDLAQRGALLRSIEIEYFRAKLKGDDAAWTHLMAMRSQSPATEPSIERMAIGARGPMESAGPATPRTAYKAFRKAGVDAAIAEIRRSDGTPEAELFDRMFAIQMLYDLSESDRVEDLNRLFDFFLERNVDMRKALIAQTELFASMGGFSDFVGICLRLARRIARDDAATLAMIEKLDTADENKRVGP